MLDGVLIRSSELECVAIGWAAWVLLAQVLHELEPPFVEPVLYELHSSQFEGWYR